MGKRVFLIQNTSSTDSMIRPAQSSAQSRYPSRAHTHRFRYTLKNNNPKTGLFSPYTGKIYQYWAKSRQIRNQVEKLPKYGTDSQVDNNYLYLCKVFTCNLGFLGKRPNWEISLTSILNLNVFVVLFTACKCVCTRKSMPINLLPPRFLS